MSDRSVLLLHPEAEYHEDYGAVLWWHLPIQEPPYVGAGIGMGERNRDGTPTTCWRFINEGWLTHWSFLPDTRLMKATDGKEVGR